MHGDKTQNWPREALHDLLPVPKHDTHGFHLARMDHCVLAQRHGKVIRGEYEYLPRLLATEKMLKRVA